MERRAQVVGGKSRPSHHHAPRRGGVRSDFETRRVRAWVGVGGATGHHTMAKRSKQKARLDPFADEPQTALGLTRRAIAVALQPRLPAGETPTEAACSSRARMVAVEQVKPIPHRRFCSARLATQLGESSRSLMQDSGFLSRGEWLSGPRDRRPEETDPTPNHTCRRALSAQVHQA